MHTRLLRSVKLDPGRPVARFRRGIPGARRIFRLAASVALLVATAGCHRSGAQSSGPDPGAEHAASDPAARDRGADDHGPTDIAINSSVAQSGLKRLGINIGGQTYWDSGQMMRNLVFRNPGFEGELRQSILHCAAVTRTTCTDKDQYSSWPANYLQGAQFEFISGAASGVQGTVVASNPAQEGRQGNTIVFAPLARPPAAGDFVLVKKTFPGGAEAGWWTSTSGGGALSTELSDLDKDSPGKQALKFSAAGFGRSASIHSYFGGASSIRLKGAYRLTFRAKGCAGNNQVVITVGRNLQVGQTNYLSKTVDLANQWKSYSYVFFADEKANATGAAQLGFEVAGADVLLDDVSLTPDKSSPANPTAFRDEVVRALIALHPGVLRYHDGATYGSSFDNIIAPVFARKRAQFNIFSSSADGIAIGLHEFLELCQTVGAEPYYDVPPGMSPAEMQSLIEYLGGDASSPYGRKRAERGQAAAWTTVFPVIHLELGNEQWNYNTFPGAAIDDPAAFGKRIATVYGAAKASPWYKAGSFDLVAGTQADYVDRTRQEIASGANYDSISVAPYLFNSLNDTSSEEAIFGSMFAQPEAVDSVPSGYMAQQAKLAAAAGKNLVVYEVNLSTNSGSATQATIDSVVPSLAAGITLADHMLLMMRDLGVKTQSVWELPGNSNEFRNTDPNYKGGGEKTPLFGVVVDMGGGTNLRRPQFLAEQLANQAILPTMLRTTLTGANPTWHQAKSANDNIVLDKAHSLQTFAFADGAQRSLIVFNLSRDAPLPVTFSGSGAPSGSLAVSRLTAKQITDSNEVEAKVAIADSKLSAFDPKAPYSLPPFSMTVFRWTAR
jgi:alpha-L-arabinofuranosidase